MNLIFEVAKQLFYMLTGALIASLIIFTLGSIAISREKRISFLQQFKSLIIELLQNKGKMLALVLFFGLGMMPLVDVTARIIYAVVYLIIVFKYIITK